MFFCEEGLAYWVQNMNKSGVLRTLFSIEFLNGHALRLVPYKWSAARAINVFMKLSKGIPGVGIGEFGRLVCRVVKVRSSLPRWEGRSRDEVDGLAVVRGVGSGG